MRSRLLTAVSALLVALGVIVVPLASVADAKNGPGKPLTVMTRNLYLGADINRPILAALAAQAQPGSTSQSVLTALANATYATRAIVDQTNFNVRARLLAKELKKTRPDLVGLQEVALWKHGPLEISDPSLIAVPNATTVDYDFLDILLKALRKKGLHYKAVKVSDRADVEAPSFSGTLAAPGADARDVRLTMRDVILKRAKNDVKVLGSGNQLYTDNLTLPLASVGKTFSFARGFQWVDVRHGNKRFRFINTHLEAFGSDLAYKQAQELTLKAPSPTRTNVIVCDCNSDPLNHTVNPGETAMHSAAYDWIRSQGFYDEWLLRKPASPGFTSGLSETVNDPTAAGFNHRIDMVFAKKAGGGALRVDRGWVTGTKLTDRDPATGLWPSDHGGVVLRLRGL